jgi:hypothetical protein
VAGAGAGTGGAAGLGGTGGCGPCPFVACLPPIWFTVSSSDQNAMIQDLVVEAPDELGIDCYANGGSPCQWSCSSYLVSAPTGSYSFTVSAPGFAAQKVELEIAPRQSCGCCGCGCENYYQGSLTLQATGDQAGACCADTRNDPANCGTCGNACSGNVCVDGTCG